MRLLTCRILSYFVIVREATKGSFIVHSKDVGDDFCIGYLHFDVRNDYVDRLIVAGQTYNSLTNYTTLQADEYDKQNDMLVSQIAVNLSRAIDSKFINANIDLKDEIYAILRYNDHFCATQGISTINVSFIP